MTDPRRWRAWCIAAAVAAAGRPAAAAPADSCAPQPGPAATVASVDERGELVLADGRTVKLAGIDLPLPAGAGETLARAARGALSQWLSGHVVSMTAVQAESDRWGRTIAAVYALPDFSAPDIDAVSVADVLVDAGLARVRPAPEARNCIKALLASEADARRNSLGLWADPYYAVIDADDAVRLADRAGTFVLVEGTVTRIGYGRTRTFVNFGPGRESFTVTIPKRRVSAFEASGMGPGTLVGVKLRIRGILDTRFGPRIEVSDPDEIERL